MCGAEAQVCCGSPDYCDNADLVCITDYPDVGQQFCWPTCTPIHCTSVEGNTTAHCSYVGGIGVCIGSPDSSPPDPDCDYYGCTDYSAVCYSYDGGYGCFYEGCDYNADCSYYDDWCASLTSGGGACLPPA
jgi:hypothetical protein